MSITNISGSIIGIGKIRYNLNVSKLKTYNPILVSQENSYNMGDCPIAAIEYQDFSPNKIINIKTKENSVYENSIDYNKIEYLVYNDYPIPVLHYPYHTTYNDKLSYLITDQFSNSQNGKPLFYQYELKFDAFTNISGLVIKNIYKNNEIKIDKNEYKIQYSYETLVTGSTRYSDTSWGEYSLENIHRVRVLLPYYFSSKTDFYTIEYDKYVYGVQSYQKELIEITSLYTSTDYTISSSGVSLTGSSKINLYSNLVIIKDPNKRINPLDIIAVKGQNLYCSDQVTQWKLRINQGSFYLASGIYTGVSGYLYNIEKVVPTCIPLSNIKPIQINSNILQVKETPIYVDETLYKYPLYKIDIYDKNIYTLYDQSGKIAIDINGVTRSDIKIKSIDRQKGFIELDSDIFPTDEIDLFFYTDKNGFILLENLELNPKVNSSGSSYNISDFPDGLGIALKPWDNTSASLYPYIYSLSLPSVGYQLLDVGTTGFSVVLDDSYFRLCEINLNRLTTDIIKVTDARIIGGGVIQNDKLNSWFITNFSGLYEREKLWYSDIGNYDGIPLAHNSVILIHIPQQLIDNLIQKWINYYKTSLPDDKAEIIGNKEFKFYLDQTIRKYISAGSDYIIIPTISGQITNKFLNLG